MGKLSLIILLIFSAFRFDLIVQAQHRSSRHQIKKQQTRRRQARLKKCVSDSDQQMTSCVIDFSAPEPETEMPFVNMRCSDCIVFAKLLDSPKPCYPLIAKAAKVSGEVQVKMIVNEVGKVIWARAVNGHPFLQSAAVKAACRAKFSPSYEVFNKNRKIKGKGLITYNFELP